MARSSYLRQMAAVRSPLRYLEPSHAWTHGSAPADTESQAPSDRTAAPRRRAIAPTAHILLARDLPAHARESVPSPRTTLTNAASAFAESRDERPESRHSDARGETANGIDARPPVPSPRTKRANAKDVFGERVRVSGNEGPESWDAEGRGDLVAAERSDGGSMLPPSLPSPRRRDRGWDEPIRGEGTVESETADGVRASVAQTTGYAESKTAEKVPASTSRPSGRPEPEGLAQTSSQAAAEPNAPTQPTREAREDADPQEQQPPPSAPLARRFSSPFGIRQG